jgi:hypothetical protein
MAAMPSGTDEVQVRLLGVPLALRRRVTEHAEEVLREVQLLAAHETDATGRNVIQRMARLRQDWPARYRQLSVDVRRRLDLAAEAGLETVDVTYVAGKEVVDVMVAMEQLFDELEELCRSGSLLTLAEAPDCAAYRRWVLGQYIEQLAGHRPMSWPDWVRDQGLTLDVSRRS